MIYKARVLLVRFAKLFPFILCVIVCLSYIETTYALIFEDYAAFGDSYCLNKPISWLIGDIMTYDWHAVIVAIVLSNAFETCVWNKLSILYLCSNLYEKNYFQDEMTITSIFIVCACNIVITSFLIYKGIKTLT